MTAPLLRSGGESFGHACSGRSLGPPPRRLSGWACICNAPEPSLTRQVTAMPARRKSSIPADPRQWSEKSKRSVSFFFTSKYEDREYKCWSCGKLATFTAEDQKYTYEFQKASIDQQRVLCEECWKTS